MHANVASFFFIFVYLHIGRGLYYGSYRSPRVLLWSIGVIILVLMIVTAFLGYVLPYGQMSLWGCLNSPTCSLVEIIKLSFCFITIVLATGLAATKIKGHLRVGPHNLDVLSIIYGTLLGDAHAERRTLGTRISFYQEAIHSEYLL